MSIFARGPWCDRCGQKQATSWLDRLCATCGPEVELEVERYLAALARGDITPKSITDTQDTAAHAAAHVQCPDCDEIIPLTLGEAVVDEDGNLTVDIQTDDVWAHSWTHECPEEDA